MEITGNLKYISNVAQYVVDGNDGTINVDTSVYAVTIILPNIRNSGYSNTTKGFIINDISGNSSINNITIIANDNSVNSTTSVVISVNGGTAKCSVANLNEWFVITEPQTGGGTVTSADNGLSLNVNTIELGGTLIQPTTITAGDIIPLTISDDKGIIFETRDANYNMRWNQINGGASIDSDSDGIFAYLSDGGTSFINSLIALHFGGACSYDSATDTWNFGDYSNFTNTNISFNLGRGNTYNNTTEISIFGNSNIIDSSNNVTVVGSNNTVIAENDMFVLGNNDLNLIIDASGNVGNEKVMNSKAHFGGLLEFTDNADALSNNLIIGDFYRTGDLLKVVH